MVSSLSSKKYGRISFGSDVRYVNLFLLGFLAYSFGSGLSDSGIIHPIFCSLIQIVGIGMFLPGAILLIDFRIDNLYLKILYYTYLFYLGTIIYRGFSFDFNYLKVTLFNQWFGIFIYASPLILLIPISVEYLKRIFTSIKLFAILYFLFMLITIPSILTSGSHEGMSNTEFYSRTFGITAGFILLTFPFHSRRTIGLAIGAIFSSLLIAVYQGRRGLAFYCFLILALASVVYLSNGKNRAVVLVLTLMILSSIGVLGMDRISKLSLFSTLSSRGMEDTRSGVEENFYQDMQPIDWAFGRGINGEYYCPGIIWGDGEPSVYRSIIETDFLQIILKGGLVSLGLLLLILIPAGLLGIFKSKNHLATAAGLWIFIGIILMYPSTINTFTFNYLLIWVCVRICFSPSIRDLSNQELKALLNGTHEKTTDKIKE